MFAFVCILNYRKNFEKIIFLLIRYSINGQYFLYNPCTFNVHEAPERTLTQRLIGSFPHMHISKIRHIVIAIVLGIGIKFTILV